uniref:Uncharacterized protein n=1 Tax=Rhizophora mucronata TaxID=61149 RepID=A0A2P2P099_RHIMU
MMAASSEDSGGSGINGDGGLSNTEEAFSTDLKI